jgi:FdhE protein
VLVRKRRAAADPLQERLAALCRESPDLREAAAVMGALLPLLRDANLGATPPAMTAEQARACLEQGRPLLRGLDLGVDEESVRDLMVGLARAREAASPSEPARRLREALERGDPGIGELLPLTAAGDRGQVAAAARRRGLDPDLLWTLAQVVLKPAFRVWRRALAPLAGGIPWHRDSCFVCGAPAVLGELRENGARHLRCLQCGASWQVRRLHCPSCGNEDHATLCTLYEEGRRGTRRVEACERCRRYVKVIAAAAPTPAEMLVVEDLATHHLDAIARERGFERQGRRGVP